MSRISYMSCAILVTILFRSPVLAATVVWPAAVLGGYSGYIQLDSEASPDGGVAVWMLIVDAGGTYTLSAEGGTTGIAHFWYETQAGQPVDALSVSTATPFFNPYTLEKGSIDLEINEAFYMGFYLSRPFSGGAVYGWAELVYDGTTLKLLDSAAETTGVGIFAGTYQAIPEPRTLGLVVAGLAVIALIRRRCRANGV